MDRHRLGYSLRGERLGWKAQDYAYRIKCAWLVLTGKADIHVPFDD